MQEIEYFGIWKVTNGEYSTGGGVFIRFFASSLVVIAGTAIPVAAQPVVLGDIKFLGNITTREAVRSGFSKFWSQITGENG